MLPETARRLREKFTALRAAGTIGPLSRICMIDDGSRDETWQIISDLHTQDPVFSGIRLSRNRGHQNACLLYTSARRTQARGRAIPAGRISGSGCSPDRGSASPRADRRRQSAP